MISVNEQKTIFSLINRELYSKSSTFFDKIKDQGCQLLELSTSDIQTKGFDPKKIYFLKDGNVTVEYYKKEILIYENGDIILPFTDEKYEQACIYYSVISEVQIFSLSLEELYSAMTKDTSLIALWFAISSISQLQLNQMIGVLTQKEERANPGFGRYKAGMEIIKEGDDADYVYSVSEGVAVAIHNGVEVGEIHQDEIFGAIAVLTDQKRTASVVAKTNCTVLMVHKDEFSKMVHSHPQLFLNILSSLAEKITSLNQKVSSQV
jgi:CRP/FNR family cyclic AMP-dependent transcriptional regulator